MDTFSEILKDLIIDKNLSLRSVAKSSGVSASQISKYLNGSIPSVYVAERLANYFNCSLDYLFGLSDNKNLDSYGEVDISKFVSRYEELLKLCGTTNWKFCKKNNLNEALIRHWRNGDTPSLNSIFIIAQNLGASIDYLVGRKDKN